jgi:hypothetical protein
MYEMGLYARQASVVHGPALYGDVAISGANVRPALWMTAQYRWPIVSENTPVGFRLDATALRLLAGVQLVVAPRWTIDLGVGGGVDMVHLEPRRSAADEQVWIAYPRAFAVGVARAMAGAKWRLAGSASAHVLFVADIDASRTRLLFESGQENEPILVPYSVRPGVALTISVP